MVKCIKSSSKNYLKFSKMPQNYRQNLFKSENHLATKFTIKELINNQKFSPWSMARQINYAS